MADALKDAVERVAAFKESRIASAYPTLIAAIDTILADLKAKDEALNKAIRQLSDSEAHEISRILDARDTLILARGALLSSPPSGVEIKEIGGLCDNCSSWSADLVKNTEQEWICGPCRSEERFEAADQKDGAS